MVGRRGGFGAGEGYGSQNFWSAFGGVQEYFEEAEVFVFVAWDRWIWVSVLLVGGSFQWMKFVKEFV